MCGIVGGVFKQPQSLNMITKSLKLLEYRGYDSAGIGYIDGESLVCKKNIGKVSLLNQRIGQKESSKTIISHTRWATHGKPSVTNAHPQVSHETIAVVHNGIIENHSELKNFLKKKGYTFKSETDTEVISHLLHLHSLTTQEWLEAIRKTCKQLEGSYALAIINKQFPETIVGVSQHSPLVIGLSHLGNFLASDMLALSGYTQQFIYLEEGDVCFLSPDNHAVYSAMGTEKKPQIHQIETATSSIYLDDHKHYMHKEIHEQPQCVLSQLKHYSKLSPNPIDVINRPKQIHITACGSSYHAGLVAKYWIEELANIPCHIEVSSESRYRKKAFQEGDLILSISQSGETADTLAAVKNTLKEHPYVQHLSFCNVPESALPRTAHASLFIHSGKEIGVAATKTFTNQLSALLYYCTNICSPKMSREIQENIQEIPNLIQQCLKLESLIMSIANKLVDAQHLMYLGRGSLYPIALEGSLKLKEISYIHAEAYPGGELKHGPLAIIDKNFPTIALVDDGPTQKKMLSNLEEISARQGPLLVFTSLPKEAITVPCIDIIEVPLCAKWLAPIIFNIPLQLLAYHIAKNKGLDVDQPRNLAKCVTVE
ncbi:MAG TPA: glutamine--fructose-6-phosphate transaminase (isomerizing) [Gammaproteobacteria bacterium]|nr:glutamine--fructose-6-phosphate transaminase (isomerizing) [Gammaproteobacteria bacterium]